MESLDQAQPKSNPIPPSFKEQQAQYFKDVAAAPNSISENVMTEIVPDTPLVPLNNKEIAVEILDFREKQLDNERSQELLNACLSKPHRALRLTSNNSTSSVADRDTCLAVADQKGAKRKNVSKLGGNKKKSRKAVSESDSELSATDEDCVDAVDVDDDDHLKEKFNEKPKFDEKAIAKVSKLFISKTHNRGVFKRQFEGSSNESIVSRCIRKYAKYWLFNLCCIRRRKRAEMYSENGKHLLAEYRDYDFQLDDDIKLYVFIMFLTNVLMLFLTWIY